MTNKTSIDRFIPKTSNQSVALPTNTGSGHFKHLFEPSHIDAINTAIACQRPLLLTGEPGVGKTQLARAAARALNRAYVRYTVDAKTESRDLLWQFDAVARLADAQLAQSVNRGEKRWDEKQCEEKLALKNYLRPGPIWWGFNWGHAGQQAKAVAPVQRDGGDPANGVVVLIDEIDKAEIDVPNGLLEALGDASFQPDGLAEPVRVAGVSPLIMITSNRERGLPDAFIRRCVMMKIELPSDENALRTLLKARGAAHTGLDEKIIEDAVERFLKDRKQARDDNHRYLPGQAEFLDLLRTIEELSRAEKSPYRPAELLDMASPYILRKGDAL